MGTFLHALSKPQWNAGGNALSIQTATDACIWLFEHGAWRDEELAVRSQSFILLLSPVVDGAASISRLCLTTLAITDGDWGLLPSCYLDYERKHAQNHRPFTLRLNCTLKIRAQPS